MLNSASCLKRTAFDIRRGGDIKILQRKNMKQIKSFFEPFGTISKSNMIILMIVQAVLALGIWQWLGAGLIPAPSKISAKVLEIIQTGNFWDNFFSSLMLTLKGMFFALLIALAVSYLSLVPFFKPLAKFIIKCRYLSLTGLIFAFTLLTNDGSQLKLSLLLFGFFSLRSAISVLGRLRTKKVNNK